MAIMKRNPNLEEIYTDALFGVSFLRYQTIWQKIIFFGSILIGIGINLICVLFFQVDQSMALLLNIVPVGFGILFGSNYNQDLSLIAYIKLSILNSSKVYYSKSTEDITYIRKNAEKIRQNQREEQNEMTDDDVRKVLLKLVVGVGAAILLFIILLIVIKASKVEDVHHTITYIDNWVRFMEC